MCSSASSYGGVVITGPPRRSASSVSTNRPSSAGANARHDARRQRPLVMQIGHCGRRLLDEGDRALARKARVQHDQHVALAPRQNLGQMPRPQRIGRSRGLRRCRIERRVVPARVHDAVAADVDQQRVIDGGDAVSQRLDHRTARLARQRADRHAVVAEEPRQLSRPVLQVRQPVPDEARVLRDHEHSGKRHDAAHILSNVTGRTPVEDLLVIVPGILGSRLRHRTRGLVWGGARTVPTLLRPGSALALNGDGLTADPDMVADGLIELPLQIPGLSKITAYTALIRALHERFELDAGNLIVFAYDWRLACAANARLLAERIAPALAERRRLRADARIVFVAHSMGGLVTAHYTDVLGGAADTRRVITIGTPFRGAAMALGAISRATVRTARAVPRADPTARAHAAVRLRAAPAVSRRGRRRRPPRIVRMRSARRRAAARAVLLSRRLPRGDRARAARAIQAPRDRRVAPAHGPDRHRRRWPGGAPRSLAGARDERGDGTVPRQSVAPSGWEDDADAVPFCQAHAALPGTDDVTRALHHVLTARPRAEQGPQRAKLALDAPDVAAAGRRLTVGVEVRRGRRRRALARHARATRRPPRAAASGAHVRGRGRCGALRRPRARRLSHTRRRRDAAPVRHAGVGSMTIVEP